ncbi:hypothetical protein [Dyadobacter sp. MSC1_007]|jgi:hypothetical protein|uniref:hypothetical protein n=1 Tax=Dyadobacter sp. MSC1_007 TaxID=2909264 RepID=UPI00202FE933|nr:hypothetical protein [Dyadobacter sp. MSC1_007]
MNKSNIFVYIELSKFFSNLSTDVLVAKQCLKSQAGYFSIITGKYFSDTLRPEWEVLVLEMTRMGPQRDESRRVTGNAVVKTLETMTPQQCAEIVLKIVTLFTKVKLELELTE